ncbi:MAG: MMPL family transporter [Bacteroidota bacterium]
MNPKLRKLSLSVFAVLAVVSVFYIFRLQFSFDFEQFFPTDDPDLEYFREFTEEFETDDNFFLIAVRNNEGVFEQDFLDQFHELTLAVKRLPYITESQSLTTISYPLKTPFGLTAIPAIHRDDPSKYEADKARILQDERFLYNLISEDAKTIVIATKVIERISLEQSEELMTSLNELMEDYTFDNYHYLGRPYFQKELVAMQKREVLVSAIVSGILVSLVMFLIFRRLWGIGTALVSIGLGMLIFMGILGITGRELNAMSALYPVLMIIVGTSDVIHIMSKYVDELKKGVPKPQAIKITVKEIGLATLLTSTTTAIGFASLLSSQIKPIRDFGINSALGVMVAYVTVICFTTAVLSYFKADQIIKLGRGEAFWSKWMNAFYHFTLRYPKQITVGGLAVLALCFLGISQVTTNYDITSNMPRGEKITEDFNYFQDSLTSFRPLELAVEAQGDYKVNDYEVLREIDKVEQYMKTFDEIRAIASNTVIYKTINQMNNGNRVDAYEFPEESARFASYKRLAERIPDMNNAVLESKDKKKARITSRIQDIGADSIQAINTQIDTWIAENTDSNIATFQQTGTGLIIDKNAQYIRRSLLLGLGGAILIVSILMVFLFRNWRMLVISLLPNIFPLLLAGALLGYLNIELEAGVAIVFAVIFGIAVDDTIHFLSKFKLSRDKGKSIEESLHITFLETGKAIALTTVILFFGFLVMLFSVHPPSVTIGLLISLTLFSALFSDLLFIPVLIRWLMKD